MIHSIFYMLIRMLSLVVIILACAVMVGCGGGSQKSTPNQSGSGSILVHLKWQTRRAKAVANKVPPSGDVCVDFLITAIRARAVNTDGPAAAETSLLDCSASSAKLTDLTPGDRYRIEVEGLIGDQVQWFGQLGEVIAGQSTDPVVVEVAYQGDDQTPPTATMLPADGTTNVPPHTAVTIRFSEDVVKASVASGNTIRLNSGTEAIAGSVTYDPNSFEAMFHPTQDLAVSSTYTVTVTNDVMDRSGQYMTQELNSQFSTTAVLFVDGDRPGSGTGASWEEAFRAIGEAVNAAAADTQIWVKAGTYVLTEQIVVNKAVALLGGFAGTETQHHQRDWTTMETVIDGDSQGRCLYISAPATVDGFTLTGGSLDFLSLSGGGAMYIDGAAAQIANCLFRDNIGDYGSRGGAIFIDGSNPRIDNCVFSDNVAGDGGAVYNNQGGPTITGSLFQNNATLNASAGFGGAIYNNSAEPDTSIAECLFKSNRAFGGVGGGGAIYNRKSHIRISNCRFKSNRSGGEFVEGGAVYNSGSNSTIQNCIFDANLAIGAYDGNGGAISNYGGTPAITNCTFVFNEAYARADDENYNGNAVASLSSSNVAIANSILWFNGAPTEAQVYTDDSSRTTISHTNIDQSISGGAGNIREHPRFGAGLHLRADSPGINLADSDPAPAADMDGETRPQGIAVDMGADEFLDSDGDRLPDYWEALHQIDAAAGDEDSDLVPNLAEYHLDTHPASPEWVAGTTLRGAVRSDGFHQASDLSAPAGTIGDGILRAFFVFDVSSVANPAAAAAVRLELAGYNSNAVPVVCLIWDVSATTTQLAANTSGQAGIDIYDDLGGGTLYGEFAPTPSDGATVLDIRLNQAAVDDINAARAGSDSFIIGLALKGLETGHLLFSEADEPRVHQLVIVEN
jgi:hypothetical protein